MVASGLPVKNGNKHAAEIATMALGRFDSFIFIGIYSILFKLDIKIDCQDKQRKRIVILVGQCISPCSRFFLVFTALYLVILNYAN